MIISGACRSINRFSLLFLLITLRYKSFKSLVANLPPSNCTIGLNSGGSTGSVFNTIHSGLFPLLRNASTTRSLFIDFLLLWPEVVLISSCNWFFNASKSTFSSICSIASAPIEALNIVPKEDFNSLSFVSVTSSPNLSSDKLFIWLSYSSVNCDFLSSWDSRSSSSDFSVSSLFEESSDSDLICSFNCLSSNILSKLAIVNSLSLSSSDNRVFFASSSIDVMRYCAK